jgi:hypothetical protein
MKPGPRNEIQALRVDGGMVHFAFDNLMQLRRVYETLEGFYFGVNHQPKASEELEAADSKRGI